VHLTSRAASSVRAAERSSQAAILALSTGGELPPMPIELAGGDRADLVHLAMCLGMFLIGWRRERRIETLVAAGPDAVAGVVDAGICCLQDWPESLHRLFTLERERASARRGKYGARKTLGAFYDWLNTLEAGPIKSALAGAASDFFAADPALARQSHRSDLVAKALNADGLVSMVEAGRQLGVRARKVRRLVNARLLRGQASHGPGTLGLLEGGRVQRLAELGADAFDLAGVRGSFAFPSPVSAGSSPMGCSFPSTVVARMGGDAGCFRGMLSRICLRACRPPTYPATGRPSVSRPRWKSCVEGASTSGAC
jgi:hypothetical protein